MFPSVLDCWRSWAKTSRLLNSTFYSPHAPQWLSDEIPVAILNLVSLSSIAGTGTHLNTKVTFSLEVRNPRSGTEAVSYAGVCQDEPFVSIDRECNLASKVLTPVRRVP